MKTKILTNTYLRDVDKYQLKLYLDEEYYYVFVKKLIGVWEKFIIKDGLCLMKDRLLEEINNKTNGMMNIDYMKCLNDF